MLAFAGFILVGINAGAGGVLLPFQIADYGIDKSTMGIAFLGFSVGYLVSAAANGFLIARWGERVALVVASGIFVGGALLGALRPAFALFVVAQALMGLGSGLIDAVLNAYIAGMDNATSLLNRLHAFFGVGALLGPVLAVAMLGAHWPWPPATLDWPSVYLAQAVLCVPLVAGILIVFPARAAAPAVVVPGPEGEAAVGGARRSLLGPVLRSPVVWAGSVFLVVYVGVEVSIGNWGFSLLVEAYGAVPARAGMVMSGYWLGLTLGRFVLHGFATRLGMGVVGFTTACLVGSIASGLLSWAASGLPGTAGAGLVASAGLVLLGFFLGPIFPTLIAVTPRLVDEHLAATAIGFFVGVSVVGGAVGPWLSGVLAQHLGVLTLLPFNVALLVGLLLLWTRLSTRLRPERG
jgi:fucose permease